MNGFSYCPYYCEENAWHLSGDPRLGTAPRNVIVVSNARRQVAMWRQRAGGSSNHPVFWDYHVFILVQGSDANRVWDLDSMLGLDVDVGEYLAQTFRTASISFRPHFRIVSADLYRTCLASDRRHMRDRGGRFTSGPPDWPPIGVGHNLDRFTDMRSPFIGEIVDLAGLEASCRAARPSLQDVR